MTVEPTPFFDEIAAKHPGLFDGEDEWQALIADPEHELVPVPDPSFSELLDQLLGELPAETVLAVEESVEAELWAKAELEQSDDYDEITEAEFDTRFADGEPVMVVGTREEAGDGGDEDDRPAGDAAGADAGRATVVVGDGGPGDGGEAGSEHAAPGGDSGSGAGGDGAD